MGQGGEIGRGVERGTGCCAGSAGWATGRAKPTREKKRGGKELGRELLGRGREEAGRGKRESGLGWEVGFGLG